MLGQSHSAGKARPMKTRTIRVNYLARVEGEGGLYVKIRGNAVVDVKLKIFEPPRFFRSLSSRAKLRRSAGYHFSHLRHLPGRLSDERDPRDGRRLGFEGRTGSCARSGGSRIAANGSKATPCMCTCCTLRISWVTPTPFRWREDHPEIVERGLKLKKWEMRSCVCSADGKSIPSTCASVASTRLLQRRPCAPLRSS